MGFAIDFSRGGAETRRSSARGEAALFLQRMFKLETCADLNGLRPAQLLRVSASPRESMGGAA